MFSSKWTVFVCLTTYFLACSGSEEKTGKPGEDVTLQCQGPRGADIDTVMLKWIRPDLKSEGFVFYFKDNQIQKDLQHESFRGRVELMDQKMEQGNFSVILKNTNINDTGRYECYVGIKGSKPQHIKHITLDVSDAGAGHTEDGGDKDGGDKDGGNKGGHVGLTVGVTVSVLLVVVVGFIIYRKRLNQQNLQPPAVDEHELRDLNP
ncbi:hypothetical protein Q5P01_000811 [Channa striata]|uniref:Ig-like domain-containing protein n=1 Tax=Channa striata TaxID=64152 RepID=A0AA88LM83_CHASR|nr:hypothetical protein Q5P01_000811 [Channa striata]